MSFWQTIREDFATIARKDPAFGSKIEYFFNYPGLWALFNYRFAHALYRRGWRTLARAIMGVSAMLTNVDIHPACSIGRRVFIDHATGVVIGETAIVGDDVTIYQGVSLGGTSLARVKRHPTIKNGVVIGAGAKILGDITIGQNAKIGANSVVVKDVPDECTAVGIPARVIIKGQSKDASAINKLPDIDKSLFLYLMRRLELLESAELNEHARTKLNALDEAYKNFLESLRN